MTIQTFRLFLFSVALNGSSVDACLHIFYTWDDNKYHLLEDFGISLQETEYLLFEVTACNDVHLLLMKDREDFVNHVYEIALGGWNNTKSYIFKGRNGTFSVYKVHEPLQCNMLKAFWLSWDGDSIHVGIGLDIVQGEFLSYNDSEPVSIKYLAVSTGFGSSGYWVFYSSYTGCCLYEPRDCQDVKESGFTESGVYSVTPGGTHTSFDVFCEMSTNNETWLVFQRRLDGSVDFYRGWDDYDNGFGNISGEFWLGNQYLSRVVAQGTYELKVELEDWDGNTRYALYSTFEIGDRTENYKLTIAGYSGDAGDSLTFQNGQRFSTKDRDNNRRSGNCAVQYQGAWWYSGCHKSNLNGKYLGGSHTSYANGVNWYTWKGYYYSMKTTKMKIKRKSV